MSTILIIILIVLLLGGGGYGLSAGWGYGPTGGIGLIVLILIVLLVMGTYLTQGVRGRKAPDLTTGRVPRSSTAWPEAPGRVCPAR